MDIKDWASWVLSYDGVIKLQGIWYHRKSPFSI